MKRGFFDGIKKGFKKAFNAVTEMVVDTVKDAVKTVEKTGESVVKLAKGDTKGALDAIRQIPTVKAVEEVC